jgi:hypothetical protein
MEKSKFLFGLGIGLIVVALFLFMQIDSLHREYQEIALINEARAELRLEKANLYRTTGIIFIVGGVVCLLFCFRKRINEIIMKMKAQQFDAKTQERIRSANIKLSTPKIALLVAIVLQFATLFLKILFVSNYHNSQRGTLITGSQMIDMLLHDYGTDVYPITGILNVIWIGLNLLFFFKSFNGKLIYNIMQILNLGFLFLTVFLFPLLLSSVGEDWKGNDRVFWYSGIYILALSFIAYFIAYLLFVVQKNKED